MVSVAVAGLRRSPRVGFELAINASRSVCSGSK
jgi:hypothetical protein